jgi:phosphatidylglycerophosphate synthase
MSNNTAIWIDASQADVALRVFGLKPLERLRRSVAKYLPAGAPVFVSGATVRAEEWPTARVDGAAGPLGARLRAALEQSGALVVLDVATVIDPRLIRYLYALPRAALAQRHAGNEMALAMRLTRASAPFIPDSARDLAEVARHLQDAGQLPALDEQDFPSYIDKLRRVVPYWIFRVVDRKVRRTVERQLFLDNYKGSTDLLTAYVYPPLVWVSVLGCTRTRIHPNVVTILSIVLAAAAVPLFAGAHWVSGFLCAYAMSVLDSVDGKLARLTLTDSKLGNVLDHGLDLVHPPFWYYAWAQGLIVDGASASMADWALWLNIFYVLDRLVLGVARWRLKHALHSSTRLDERVRSIIARRNITMTIIAVTLLLGLGVWGFIYVAVWQVLTFTWHGWRTLWLGWLRPLPVKVAKE